MFGFGIWFLEAVLDKKVQVVTLVEHLAPHIGVQLSKPFDLSILLRDKLLTHRRDLDVEVVVREVEIGFEQFYRFVEVIPLDWELSRLVVPLDAVEVEKSREFPFAVVCEVGEVGRRRPKEIVSAQFPAAFAISVFATRSAAWSGKSLWISPATSS